MFLSCQRVIATSQRRLSRARGERGSALMAVIAVMGVTLLLAMLVASVTLQALSFTSSTRAGVQSKAAASAGIDAAMLSLLADASNPAAGCVARTGNTGVYPASDLKGTGAASGYSASYTVKVQVPNASGTFVTACPTADSVGIKLISTGTASAKGVAGSNSNDTHTVEAMYAQTVATGGPAIYSYVAGNMSNLKTLGAGAPADIELKAGALQCDGVLATGSIILGGEALPPGSTPLPSWLKAGDANVEGPCTIDGSLYAPGNVSIRGTVKGDVHAGGNVDLAGTVRGTVYAAGTISKPSSAKVKPGTPYNPPRQVPAWQDFAYSPLTWQIAGYQVVNWKDKGWCKVEGTATAGVGATSVVKAYLEGLTQKTVFDARGCASFSFGGGVLHSFAMKTDVAFITPSTVNLAIFNITSADGNPHQWLMLTPDALSAKNNRPDKPTPTCTAQFDGAVRVKSPMVMLMYTPCKITNSAAEWRGQFYGGQVDVDANVALEYAGVSVPGLQMNGSAPVPGDEVAVLLANRTYLRDLDG